MIKRLLLALAFAILPISWAGSQPGFIGPPYTITCNQGVPFSGTATLSQAVAAVTGARVYVCGWSVTNTAASGTFLLAYGTGTNCGTNTTNLTPALSVGTTQLTDHAAYASLQTVVSGALCVNATATVTGMLWISQF